MSLDRLFTPQTRQARAALRAARENLVTVSERDRDVTDEYLDANAAVIAAEKPLRWWQRLDIELSAG